MGASIQVVIEVSGGVAEVTEKTSGVRVTLIDYDVDGSEEGLSKDKDGNPCTIRVYALSETV